MSTNVLALSAIPPGLRDPLIEEYKELVHNHAEHRWRPAELNGGRFCEIVYTIVEGYGSGRYAAQPSKPTDFVSACRRLEAVTTVPRSFQILIPRLLPGLYEIRNNRGVGHVGGDVDSNHMDANAVLAMCNWIMSELVRVYHGLSIPEAQQVVDSLSERRIPLVWQRGDLKRVLDPTISLEKQILLLIASSPGAVTVSDLLAWCDYENATYFRKLLRRSHRERKIELSEKESLVEILPPGAKEIGDYIASRTKHM
jgi:hypothetical protein